MLKSLAALVLLASAFAAAPAASQPLPFEVCTAASGDGVVRCTRSADNKGRQSVEIQIPANSFHVMSVKPLYRRDVSIELKCVYRDTGGSDPAATVVDGQLCPASVGQSMHIKSIALGLSGQAASHYIVGYRCWTSKYGDPTKTEQSKRIWYGKPGEPCGIVADNTWISGIEIYTYGYPEFP